MTPSRSVKPCQQPGCPNLVDRGYCPDHAPKEVPEGFEALRRKEKSPEDKAFYSGSRWTKASKRHRAKEPLCRPCHARGVIVAAQMVHHDPTRAELLAMGESPYNDKYLVSMCNRCHMDELRKMRGK